jgi:hypothetical protein
MKEVNRSFRKPATAVGLRKIFRIGDLETPSDDAACKMEDDHV